MDGTKHKRMSWLHTCTLYEKCKSIELITVFHKQCMHISYKSIKSQWSNLARFTVLQSFSVAVPLLNNFDTQIFTIVAPDNSDNADRNSLSGRKHAHDSVITVSQVKPSTMKSKPTMSSTDISATKNLEKLKCQEILSFHYNQKFPLECIFLVGQELYTNPQIADNLSTVEFILSCFQSVLLRQTVGEKDIIHYTNTGVCKFIIIFS